MSNHKEIAEIAARGMSLVTRNEVAALSKLAGSLRSMNMTRDIKT